MDGYPTLFMKNSQIIRNPKPPILPLVLHQKREFLELTVSYFSFEDSGENQQYIQYNS